MKNSTRVAALLPCLLAACFPLAGCFPTIPLIHRKSVQSLAPALPEAPPAVLSPADPQPPVSANLETAAPTANTPPQQPATVEPKEPTKPPVRHKKQISKAANPSPPPTSTPQQATVASPGVSAIGQLSSGDPSDLRRQTIDSIAATERGLNGIGRRLSDQEEKTAVHIREFLKEAREALATGDVDGAHTLAAKAKVLFSELTP